MNWFDLAIIVILLLSALIGIFRGFVKEMISLASWGAAFWVSFAYAGPLAVMLPRGIDEATLRTAIAFLTLFIVTLIVGGLVNLLVVKIVRQTGLSGMDRSLGLVFGCVRGAFIVAMLVLLAGFTTLPQDPAWRASRLRVHFESAAGVMQGWLPEDIAARVPSPS